MYIYIHICGDYFSTLLNLLLNLLQIMAAFLRCRNKHRDRKRNFLHELKMENLNYDIKTPLLCDESPYRKSNNHADNVSFHRNTRI